MSAVSVTLSAPPALRLATATAGPNTPSPPAPSPPAPSPLAPSPPAAASKCSRPHATWTATHIQTSARTRALSPGSAVRGTTTTAAPLPHRPRRLVARYALAVAQCPACKGDFDASFCPRDGTRLVALAGSIISDRYRLLRKVGEGAMGEVYEAEHVHLHRRVAVKLLQRRIASEPEAMARFQREA